MPNHWNRRQLLQQLVAASGAAFLPARLASGDERSSSAEDEIEIQISQVSAHTFRLSVLPVENGQPAAIPFNGSLVQKSWGPPIAKFRGEAKAQTIKCGELSIAISDDPLAFSISDARGQQVQKLVVDRVTGVVSFLSGDAPLLGLGEGGAQFDRRGSTDNMISGQGGYHLATHGGRVPIPWIIGTGSKEKEADGSGTGDKGQDSSDKGDGGERQDVSERSAGGKEQNALRKSAGGWPWAIFFHQPFGTFDLNGPECRFEPADENKAAAPKRKGPFPLDLFFVAAPEPAAIMAEYARLTGHAEMPPLWSFGYQQSHRTLGDEQSVIEEAKTFREKKLPCDAMIYLGTGFCPNGWNTENGSFVWNSRVFPEPKKSLDALHQQNFKAIVHVVILSDRLSGTVHDPCDVARFDEEKASCHWDAHRRDFATGVDGWWPDEGDPLDLTSRLARNRMYWEGPQMDRPNERPYALHRNGYAGMQRYGSFLWSGDVASTWETLKTHIPVAVNTALSGIPYWGTDIGGFVPTKEFTAELYVRWFQFGAFCPLFRCHGRTWKLRLPWGWNTGDPGPIEITNYRGAATPDPSELHNSQVEPICKKYLELRYRMLPYLYSAVRECATTGMPILRALWLHYPDDAKAVACGDEYLWGRSLLVAPVVEKGAASRQVYLPKGDWFDFWTGEKTEGGRGISRTVDLETMPLYARAGSILLLGPIKQYTGEKVDGPLEVRVYPGGDCSFLAYEDDGKSFDFRKGEWMGIEMKWNDAQKKLSLRLAEGSRMLAPLRRKLEVRLGAETRQAVFEAKPTTVSF